MIYDRTELVLGCGNRPRPSTQAINHDLTKHHDFVDVTHDLNIAPWPWPDNRFNAIFAEDVLEHLQDFMMFFNESWRIMKEGGVIYVQVPSYKDENAWRDPTHIRPYHPDAFSYLDPDTYWGNKYDFYTDRKWRLVSVEDGGNIVAVLSKRS